MNLTLLFSVGGMYEEIEREMNLVDFGFRLPSALKQSLNFEEFEKLLSNILHVSATPGNMNLKTQGEFVEQLIRPMAFLIRH